MKSITFVHASDFHLGASFCGGYGDYGSIRRKDVLLAFEKTIDLVISESADLLLICGDLFEQDSVTRDTIIFIRQVLNRLTKTHVCILPGNHDPLLVDSWYKAFDWPDYVHLLEVGGNQPASLWLEDLQVFIAAYGFSSYRQDELDWSALPEPKPGAMNIIMLHGSLDINTGPIMYNSVSTDQLQHSRYQYIAMGHFHNYFVIEGASYIANPGSPEPLGFDETNTHGILLGSWHQEQNRITTEFIPIANRQYHIKDVNITSCIGEDAVKMAILSCIENNDPQKDFVHIRLQGNPIESPVVNTILDKLREEWLYLRISDSTYPPVQWNKTFQENGLVGLFLSEIEEKMNHAMKTENDDTLDKLKKARQMGIEALAYGSISTPVEI